MSLIVTPTLYAQIAAHLQQAYPNEGAGLLFGSANGAAKTVQVVKVFANRFEAEEQYHRYLITAEDMLEGETEAERLGLDIIGVFHSHPDHPAQASEYDREYAVPWYSYLIVSVQNGQPTTARSWILNEDSTQFLEESFVIKREE